MIPLDRTVAPSCGPKAARLAALRRAGLPVPDGFVVTADLADAALAGVAGTLTRELARLGDSPVAVRSSAAGEDAAGSSAAGQYVTVLGVQSAAAVAAAIQSCRDSWHSPRARAYRQASGQSDAGGMAVLVQRMVDADVAGVMFTGSEGVDIEASWGLGPSVVNGTVSPDAFHVGTDGSISRRLGAKSSRLDRRGSLVVRSASSERDQRAPCLDDAVIGELAAMGQRVARVLEGPHDIEWALADGRLWLLQSRPVTARLPQRQTDRASSRDSRAAHRVAMSGTPGSPGTATGTARIVCGPSDFAQVRAGDILVCPFTDPAWTPLLGVASGVVTERGGALSHAAIVARERRIPAVLDVHDATTRLHNRSTVTVDGTAGTVVVHTS
ncbi:PEP/pyruvate-binding domain-containing protein [Pseudactinotalea sp.]|uniref:PEP/pyruvate-binding domain-containing protein n=1 Tax=Pseudactinotalea sp. TaxID=1926260 RepID=UPI003B3BA2A6